MEPCSQEPVACPYPVPKHKEIGKAEAWKGSCYKIYERKVQHINI
jgi:hypothetical protein